MSKHTPGPWSVTQETGVLTLGGIICCSNSKQAHLIAAAPELLDALKLFMSVETFDEQNRARDFAVRAISKAEGRDS